MSLKPSQVQHRLCKKWQFSQSRQCTRAWCRAWTSVHPLAYRGVGYLGIRVLGTGYTCTTPPWYWVLGSPCHTASEPPRTAAPLPLRDPKGPSTGAALANTLAGTAETRVPSQRSGRGWVPVTAESSEAGCPSVGPEGPGTPLACGLDGTVVYSHRNGVRGVPQSCQQYSVIID